MVFSDAAMQRQGLSWASPGYDLKTAIAGVDDRLAEIIEDAPHPFSQAVREAVEAEQERA